MSSAPGFASFNIGNPFGQTETPGRKRTSRRARNLAFAAPNAEPPGQSAPQAAPPLNVAAVDMGFEQPVAMPAQQALRYQNMGLAKRGPSPGAPTADQIDRRRQAEATFAEAGPAPQTQEAWARRKAYVEGRRGNVSMPTATPPAAPAGLGAKEYAGIIQSGLEAFATPEDAIAAADKAKSQFGAPTAAPPTPRPYDAATAPQTLPTEAQFAASNGPAEAAAAAQRKSQRGITEQQARAMWTSMQNSPDAFGTEGYNARAAFLQKMAEYGVQGNAAEGMLAKWANDEQNPQRWLTPGQLDQARQSPDPFGAATAMSPMSPGSAAPMPGYSPLPRTAPSMPGSPGAPAAPQQGVAGAPSPVPGTPMRHKDGRIVYKQADGSFLDDRGQPIQVLSKFDSLVQRGY